MTRVQRTRLTAADLRAVQIAIDYVEKHYRERISADQLAIEVGLSKSKLQTGLFLTKKETVHQFILTVRVEKAKEYLHQTNTPIKSIASLVGFSDESHLCNVFKRLVGISPREYRLQCAE